MQTILFSKNNTDAKNATPLLFLKNKKSHNDLFTLLALRRAEKSICVDINRATLVVNDL